MVNINKLYSEFRRCSVVIVNVRIGMLRSAILIPSMRVLYEYQIEKCRSSINLHWCESGNVFGDK